MTEKSWNFHTVWSKLNISEYLSQFFNIESKLQKIASPIRCLKQWFWYHSATLSHMSIEMIFIKLALFWNYSSRKERHEKKNFRLHYTINLKSLSTKDPLHKFDPVTVNTMIVRWNCTKWSKFLLHWVQNQNVELSTISFITTLVSFLEELEFSATVLLLCMWLSEISFFLFNFIWEILYTQQHIRDEFQDICQVISTL